MSEKFKQKEKMQEVFEKILERLEELAKSDEIRALKTEEDETISLITALQAGADRYRYVIQIINQLAEEQGLLLKLPCKVGDTVYAYCSEFGILSYTVDSIVIDEHITYQCSAYSVPIGDCQSECLDEIEPDIADFGKTVFLSREQIEQICAKQVN